MVRRMPATLEFGWHGRRYRAAPPEGATLPAFLTVHGVLDPPPGDLVLVLRRRVGLLSFLRPSAPFLGAVAAQPAAGD
jgi:hypothetical protein